MEQRTITVVLWIDKEIPLYESIFFFAEFIKNETGKSLKKIELSITDKSKNNWKLFSRSFANTKKGFDKLKIFLAESREKMYEINFSLESFLKKYSYKAIDIDVHIGYTSGNFCKLNFLFNEQENKDIDLNCIIIKTYDYLIRNEVNIKYGFGFVMENKKMPGFFCNGIYTENLTKREKETASIISNKHIMDLINVPFLIQVINKNYVDFDNEKVKECVANDKAVNLNDNIILINNG